VTEDRQTHWDRVYTTRAPESVSWFQPSPDRSLKMVEATGAGAGARIVDIGGGASSLVDRLLERGFQVTVLDVAEPALETVRRRLGDRAQAVDWQVADITRWRPAKGYDVWHDRAVFHFLTEAPDRRRYVSALQAALKPGGWAILATFAEDGPERCSGLPVRRYSPAALASELGEGFELIEHDRENHVTPGGGEQVFTWTLFRKTQS